MKIINCRPISNQTFYIHGFSLLELLIVLLISAGVVTIAVSSFSGIHQSMKSKSFARTLVNALKTAKSNSISQNKETSVIFSTKKGQFKISGENKIWQLPEFLDLKLLTVENEVNNKTEGGIKFYSDGSSTGGQIELSTSNKKFIIDVSWLTGKIRLVELHETKLSQHIVNRQFEIS